MNVRDTQDAVFNRTGRIEIPVSHIRRRVLSPGVHFDGLHQGDWSNRIDPTELASAVLYVDLRSLLLLRRECIAQPTRVFSQSWESYIFELPVELTSGEHQLKLQVTIALPADHADAGRILARSSEIILVSGPAGDTITQTNIRHCFERARRILQLVDEGWDLGDRASSDQAGMIAAIREAAATIREIRVFVLTDCAARDTEEITETIGSRQARCLIEQTRRCPQPARGSSNSVDTGPIVLVTDRDSLRVLATASSSFFCRDAQRGQLSKKPVSVCRRVSPLSKDSWSRYTEKARKAFSTRLERK